ncbi:hypothetical protein GCM10010468_41880 [Actinocorallia longicatena]|uniref:Acid phosphatase of HAD superfamily subfamily IIIB n=1 Tax=Actinocorallia longicatena TaxID=111803 RepID=A0ABP6QDM2_9ACTN
MAGARARLGEALDAGAVSPAIVLDIDDTCLSTYDQETGTSAIPGAGFGYFSPLWNHWAYTIKQFPAIAPALALATEAAARGVAVFYVTGRRDAATTAVDPVTFATTVHDVRAETLADLRAKGFPAADPARLHLRPPADHAPSVVPYKAGTRAAIEALGHTIVTNLGDQHSDLEGGHARHPFKLPNPMYAIP